MFAVPPTVTSIGPQLFIDRQSEYLAGVSSQSSLIRTRLCELAYGNEYTVVIIDRP